MNQLFVHHRIDTAPRQWQAVAERLALGGAQRVSAAGGQLYGLWRSQIGRPRDEIQAITVWPSPMRAAEAERVLLLGEADVWTRRSEVLLSTLRPKDATPPRRQGNYAFRWFATPQRHWPEFLDLCASAWPGFESAYDLQVIGLWQAVGDRTGTDNDEVTGAEHAFRRAKPAADPTAQSRDVGALEAAGRRGRIESARHAEPPLRPVRLDRRLHSDASDCGR